MTQIEVAGIAGVQGRQVDTLQVRQHLPDDHALVFSARLEVELVQRAQPAAGRHDPLEAVHPPAGVIIALGVAEQGHLQLRLDQRVQAEQTQPARSGSRRNRAAPLPERALVAISDRRRAAVLMVVPASPVRRQDGFPWVIVTAVVVLVVLAQAQG